MKISWILLGLAVVAPVVMLSYPKNLVDMRGTHPRQTCFCNLQILASAIDQWAFDRKALPGTPVGFGDICPAYVRRLPTCPQGGEYYIEKVGSPPICAGAESETPHILLARQPKTKNRKPKTGTRTEIREPKTDKL